MQRLRLVKFVISLILVATVVMAQKPSTDPPLLSKTDPGYAFVERIQKHYCEEKSGKPSHNCKFDVAKCREFVTNLWPEMFREPAPPEALKINCDRVSTEYELPGTYTLLHELFSEVREVAPDVGLRQLDDVHFGSLPIRAVNARVLPPEPGLGHFLFFHIRFFEFASELAKVAALSLPMKVENDLVVIDGSLDALREKLATDKEIQFLFANRLFHFLEVESLKPLTPPENIQPILSRYQQGIELFAMAHEYSHLALNHGGASMALESADSLKNSLSVSGPSGNWAQELEADFYAAKIVRRISLRRLAAKDAHVAEYLLTATPQFYFIARQIVTEANDIVFNNGQIRPQDSGEPNLLKIAINCTKNNKCDLADTLSRQANLPQGHPSPGIRKEFAGVLLEENVASADESKTAMTTLATQMNRNIDYLWRNVRTHLQSPAAASLIKSVREKRSKLE